jgi:hypothetical protein
MAGSGPEPNRPWQLDRPLPLVTETSRNWSGAYLTAGPAESFQQVWGRWWVPERLALPQETGAAPALTEHRCSTWIGLDGHSQASRSLPQVGLLHAVSVDGNECRERSWAWHQWWVRGEEFPPFVIENMPIAPNDEMICCVTVVSPLRVLFHVKNQTTGKLANAAWDAPSPDAPVEGRTAEWVVERPARLLSNQLYPLPGYGSITFDCAALATQRHTGVAASRGLRDAKLIRLYEEFLYPHRTGSISVPVRINDTVRIHDTRMMVRHHDGGS